MSAPQIERREFLKFSLAAGGGLLIGFSLPGADMFATAQAQSITVFMPNAFLRIGTDDRVTVIVNHSEMGQGVYTALPMLLAEELDADWNKIGFESAPVDPKYNPRHADRCRSATMERESRDAANRLRSRIRRHKSQADLWPTGRSCSEIEPAR